MVTSQICSPPLELTLGVKGSPDMAKILYLSLESVVELGLELSIAREDFLDGLIVAHLTERSLQLPQRFQITVQVRPIERTE